MNFRPATEADQPLRQGFKANSTDYDVLCVALQAGPQVITCADEVARSYLRVRLASWGRTRGKRPKLSIHYVVGSFDLLVSLAAVQP